MYEEQHDHRYGCALHAAVAILGELEANPGLAPHERLARTVYGILRGMDRWEIERRAEHGVRFSLN